MRAFFLLVILIGIVAYVRAEQPATWNSWMVALGAATATNSDFISAAPDGTPTPEPPRTFPVGGVIQDGNFAQGNRYWQGDGQSDPSGKGLVVTLNPSAWTRVYQTFPSDKGVLYSIEVTFRFSPGLTVSQNPEDYTDISKRLQLSGFEDYKSMPVPVNYFYGTIGDPTSNRITCEVYPPAFKTTRVQDYQHTYATIPPFGNKTFALAFPPGSGTVTLLTAYVTCQ
jgi:hypothetical protein